jgi:hypothetical protein
MQPDRERLRLFVDGLFRRASSQVSLRAFLDLLKALVREEDA